VRTRAVAVSVAIHVVLAVAIVVAGVASRPAVIDVEIVAPSITTAEVPPPPPPPPPVPRAPGGSPVVGPVPAPRPPSARKPRPPSPAIPEPLAAPEPTEEPGELATAPGGEAETDVAGGDGGSGGGIGGGVGEGIDIDRSARPIPLNASQLHTLPYTEEAARAGVSGRVLLILTVDPDGRVRRAIVRRGLGHGLDEIAKRIAMQIQFRPALDRAGKPTAALVRWGFLFQPP
jgi:TonB family protein